MQPSLRNTLLFLALAGLSLLGIGAAQAQYTYQTRGIPPGFAQPIPHGQARMGLNVQLHQYNDQELAQALNEITELGISAVKHPVYYAGDLPVPWPPYDRIIDATHSAGLEFVALLDGSPEADYAPPTDLHHFANWAGEFAARYQGRIAAYIIWDEPNLASHWGNQPPNPVDYAALLSTVAQEIRAADHNAIIVAAPLAPTVETGPENLNEVAFLQQLYAAGAADAFDVVAAKPYGFDTGPDDRRVDVQVLNFSRAILLHEVLVQNGEPEKAVWAGNWGWNSLPPDWTGDPSIWGQTNAAQQAEYTVAAWERARREWPWMGYMFLGKNERGATEDNPVRGFQIRRRPVAAAITAALHATGDRAYPGFHPAGPDQPGQAYSGAWRFSPEFGADIGQTGDQVQLHFWGTDLALRVRRGDFRARFLVTVDGKPANALPADEAGTVLVLTAPDANENETRTIPIALRLSPGAHTATITANRGWDQWALSGFTPAYQPTTTPYRLVQALLAVVAVGSLMAAFHSARKVEWSRAEAAARHLGDHLSDGAHLALTTSAAVIVGLSGYLTWGGEAAGLYRRLGDGGQIALTAAAASLFYITPSFLIYAAALVILFILIYARPAWGMAVVAFSFPFYVVPKPMLGYRFSPVEIFLLVTTAATLLRWAVDNLTHLHQAPPDKTGRGRSCWSKMWSQPGKMDLAVLALVLIATLSLLFTSRLDVALNEWRVVIIEPALFYLLWRLRRLEEKEVWIILDAFMLSGVVVAGYGLVRYAMGENIISVAGGLGRLRSFYGSPNNVALYLGRIMPFLGAMLLLGRADNGWRRWLYVAAILPVGVALLLTFSKGAFFLGLPVTGLILLILWRRTVGGRVWPWLLGLGLATAIALILALGIPGLSSRLNLGGYTSFLRLNLWRSSLNMIADQPIFGVGLDNFLYEYRSRYILDAAWQEPDLNHPHNLFLDFWTRLGVFGLLAGLWLFGSWIITLARLARGAFTGRDLSSALPRRWLPVLAGLIAACGQIVAHGLVDHSFFLVDLAFTFFFFIGLTGWLHRHYPPANH
jgi:O-antigen ligase